MKKIFSSFLVVAMLLAGIGMVSTANAAFDTDNIQVNLEVQSTIALACDDTVNMEAITGTGVSDDALTNTAVCNVITNNSNGYKLEWETGTVDMTNADADTILGASTTPAAWSVAAGNSAWGANVTGADSVTGAANTDFAGVSAGKTVIATSSDNTAFDGTNTSILFKAEVGASKWQPTGIYQTSVTMTATTL